MNLSFAVEPTRNRFADVENSREYTLVSRPESSKPRSAKYDDFFVAFPHADRHKHEPAAERDITRRRRCLEGANYGRCRGIREVEDLHTLAPIRDVRARIVERD